MQIIKVNHQSHVLVSLPVEVLAEAGISPGDIFEIYVDGSKIIIQNAEPDADFVCSGDCDNCPVFDVDCDNDCEHCPCYQKCNEESEVSYHE